ncbi:MAG: peptide chain release factor 1 [bacterium]
MFAKLESMKQKYEEITRKLGDPAVVSRHSEYQKYAKLHAEISEIVGKYDEYKDVERRIEEDKAIIKANEDKDLVELAKIDLEEMRAKRERLERELKVLLLPKDPYDEKDIIVEIRAGTGGEEAALFAGDLYRMYSRYIEDHGWRMELIYANETGLGGFKEITFAVGGRGAYGKLKYESGVHRVQRVPETEASGRIHTSAATVAVMPEPDEVEIEIDERDLRVDVFRSSGHGGQSVNTTDSAVRITHLPTGLVATCQDERSQLKNKAKAMRVLKAKLLDLKRREVEEEMARLKRSQVRSGDRSEKIRTYNFHQGRVTDHRINYTTYNLEKVLDGELDDILERLAEAERIEKLANLKVS